MAMSDSAKPAARRRIVLALVALGVVVGALYLSHSGRLDVLITLAMEGPQQLLQPNRQPDFVVRVIDEQGQPVPAFQARLGRSDRVGCDWTPGFDGHVLIPGFMIDGEATDAVVRADGFASTYAHVAGSEREELLAGNGTITMRRGEKVELRFRLPQGLDWPAKLTPEVYFAGYQRAVRIIWQPENRRIYGQLKGHSMLDSNYLNAKGGDAGRVALRLARGGEPFLRCDSRSRVSSVLRARAVHAGGRNQWCSGNRRSKTRRSGSRVRPRK